MANIDTALLQKFGLSQPEITIYLALLQLEKPNVSQISRKTGLQRTNIYFHLAEMVGKDLAKEVGDGKVKRFLPTPPKELANRFQRWTTDILSMVPELEALQAVDEQTPVISVRNIKSSHYDHYNEIASMPKDSEFRVIQGKRSADADFQAFKPGEYKKILERMIERNIMTRAIFTDDLVETAKDQLTDDLYALFKQRNWQLRSVNPETFHFEEMMIHQDKVSFLLTDIGIMVQIQHKRIAKAMTAMFDALWLTGKPNAFK